MSSINTSTQKECILIIDSSSSMKLNQFKVISGINEYLNTQKEEFCKDDTKLIRVTLITFNSQAKIVFSCNLKDIPTITTEHYNPNGMTALYTGIHSIKKISTQLKDAIILIWTDGQENASDAKLYTKKNTKEYIKTLIDNNCSITYMGCDFDAYDSGVQLGLSSDQTCNYSSFETKKLFKDISDQTTKIYKGEAKHIKLNQKEYTNYITPKQNRRRTVITENLEYDSFEPPPAPRKNRSHSINTSNLNFDKYTNRPPFAPKNSYKKLRKSKSVDMRFNFKHK